MKYSIERTAQFKRDFKLAEKQGLDMTELAKVISVCPIKVYSKPPHCQK